MSGSIKTYTPNFKMIIPEFNVATWHDYIEENFRSIDALFYNLFGINGFSGIWKTNTVYKENQVLFIGEDNGSEYEGRLVKVTQDTNTAGFATFSEAIKRYPDHYEMYADASSAEVYAALAKDWATKTDGTIHTPTGEDTGEYSAKHHAQLAASHEEACEMYRNLAKTDSELAKESELVATTQAQIATTQANNAETSATNAANSANLAQGFANDAETSLNELKTTATDNFNTNASQKTDSFNDNYDSKLSSFNTNATSKTNDFNTNATQKTNQVNTIASTISDLVNGFDENVATKTNEFNQNAVNKTKAFDTNATTKTQTFNTNASEKQTLVDASASNAQLSATNAKTSETNAKTSENNAKSYSEQAESSATTATQMSNSASTYATTATTQAGIATTQAGMATTKAQNAEESASIATSKAGVATIKAQEASNSATNASSSATSASNSADLAESWAVGDNVSRPEGSAKYWAEQAHAGQLQSDWNQTDSTEKDFIKNKPTKLSQFTNDSNFVNTTQLATKQDIANLSQTLDTSTSKYPSNNAVKTAIDNIDALPPQSGNSGKFLTTNGTNASWEYTQSNKIGEIIQMASTSDYIPDGCLPCDGSEYAKEQFSDLWDNYLIGEQETKTIYYAWYSDPWGETVYTDSATPAIGDDVYMESYTGQEIIAQITSVGNDNISFNYKYSPCLRYSKGDITETINKPLLNTCTYTEYESDISTYGQCAKFGVDTANNKFKVPTLPNKMITSQVQNVPVKGNGMAVGLTNGTTTGGLTTSYAGNLTTYTGNYGQSVGSAAFGTVTNNVTHEITTDPTKSGIVADLSTNTVELRFFVVVANGQINQSMMDWSAWASSLVTKANTDLSNMNASQSAKETIVGWGMPDYSAGISQTTSNWSAPSNGWVYWRSASSGGAVYCNGVLVTQNGYYTAQPTQFFPVSKNDTITFTSQDGVVFYPCKGEI